MKTNSLLNQNIYRLTAKYISLNVLSMFCYSLYILADTFFVANGVGNQGIVALNLALPIYSLLNGTGLMIGAGGATHFSIAVGERNYYRGNQIFSHAFALSLIFGLIFTCIGVFFSDPVSRLLGADHTTLPMTKTYIRTVFSFSCVFVVNNCLLAFIRNDGNPNLAMVAMLCGSFTNIIFDYIFVFPCQMGMFGAALATGGSPIVSLCILSSHFWRKKNSFKLQRLHIKWKQVGKIFAAGFPSLVGELSAGTVILLFNYVILSLSGEIGVGAYGIIANIALVCLSIYNGIGQGIQPIISLNFGAQRMKQVKKVLFCACTVALLFGVLIYLCGLFFADPIIAAFNRDRNAELATLTKQGISLYFIGFLFMGLNISFTSFFASMSKTKPSFLISMLRGIILVVPTVLILPSLFQMNGVWCTVPVVEFLTFLIGLILMICFFKNIQNRTENEKTETP